MIIFDRCRFVVRKDPGLSLIRIQHIQLPACCCEELNMPTEEALHLLARNLDQCILSPSLRECVCCFFICNFFLTCEEKNSFCMKLKEYSCPLETNLWSLALCRANSFS